MTPFYDAAVVLGAAIQPDGRPSPAMRRRIAHGVGLYREGRVGHLLLSGGCVEHETSEASAMRLIALEAGLPADVLTLEERSVNTLENARFCRPIIARRGWRRLLLVTDGYHLPRALYTFRRFGMAVDGAAAPAPRWSGPLLAAAARETVALLIYLWRIERALRAP